MTLNPSLAEVFARFPLGTRVLYAPHQGASTTRYAGTVASAPHLCGGTWCVALADMAPEYRDGKRSTVPSAVVDRLTPVVCFRCDDSHTMTLGERKVMCTACPVPCHVCGAGGPFCTEGGNCGCSCHRKSGRSDMECADVVDDSDDSDSTCADCSTGITLADGHEHTDPPLCHACEKARLEKRATLAENRLATLAEDFASAFQTIDGWLRSPHCAVGASDCGFCARDIEIAGGIVNGDWSGGLPTKTQRDRIFARIFAIDYSKGGDPGPTGCETCGAHPAEPVVLCLACTEETPSLRLKAALARVAELEADLDATRYRVQMVAESGCTARVLAWSPEDLREGLSCTEADRCAACRCEAFLAGVAAPVPPGAPPGGAWAYCVKAAENGEVDIFAPLSSLVAAQEALAASRETVSVLTAGNPEAFRFAEMRSEIDKATVDNALLWDTLDLMAKEHDVALHKAHANGVAEASRSLWEAREIILAVADLVPQVVGAEGDDARPGLFLLGAMADNDTITNATLARAFSDSDAIRDRAIAIDRAAREWLAKSPPPARPEAEPRPGGEPRSEGAGGGEVSDAEVAAMKGHEVHTYSALLLGFNELAKLTPVLGEKLYFRLRRDAAHQELTTLGHHVEMTGAKIVLTLGQRPPFVKFLATDIEAMRGAVAAHDAGGYANIPVDSIAGAIAQLRHLYAQMLGGRVRDTAEAARGLLGPAIERLERLERASEGGAT